MWLKSHGGWALFEPRKSTPGPVLLTALLHWLSCYASSPSSPSLSSFHQLFLPFFFLFRFVEGLLTSSYDVLCYNEHRINDTIIKIKTFSSTPKKFAVSFTPPASGEHWCVLPPCGFAFWRMSHEWNRRVGRLLRSLLSLIRRYMWFTQPVARLGALFLFMVEEQSMVWPHGGVFLP